MHTNNVSNAVSNASYPQLHKTDLYQIPPDGLSVPKLLNARHLDFPESISESDLRDYWIQEKLNGWMCFYTGGRFVTKRGNPKSFSKLNPLFVEYISTGVPMMGELYVGPHTRNDGVNSAISRDQSTLKYVVFDIPGHPGNYKQRYTALRNLVTRWNTQICISRGLMPPITQDQLADLPLQVANVYPASDWQPMLAEVLTQPAAREFPAWGGSRSVNLDCITTALYGTQTTNENRHDRSGRLPCGEGLVFYHILATYTTRKNDHASVLPAFVKLKPLIMINAFVTQEPRPITGGVFNDSMHFRDVEPTVVSADDDGKRKRTAKGCTYCGYKVACSYFDPLMQRWMKTIAYVPPEQDLRSILDNYAVGRRIFVYFTGRHFKTGQVSYPVALGRIRRWHAQNLAKVRDTFPGLQSLLPTRVETLYVSQVSKQFSFFPVFPCHVHWPFWRLMVWSCCLPGSAVLKDLDEAVCWPSVFERPVPPNQNAPKKTYQKEERRGPPALRDHIVNACMLSLSEIVIDTMEYCENFGFGNVAPSLCISDENLVTSWAAIRVSDNPEEFEDERFYLSIVLTLIAHLWVTVGSVVGLGSVNSIQSFRSRYGTEWSRFAVAIQKQIDVAMQTWQSVFRHIDPVTNFDVLLDTSENGLLHTTSSYIQRMARDKRSTRKKGTQGDKKEKNPPASLHVIDGSTVELGQNKPSVNRLRLLLMQESRFSVNICSFEPIWRVSPKDIRSQVESTERLTGVSPQIAQYIQQSHTFLTQHF